MDGKETPDGADVREAIQSAAESSDSVVLTVRHQEGGVSEKTVTFITDQEQNKIIGIRFKAHHNPVTGIKNGMISCFAMEREMLILLGKLFTGQGSANDVVGPVGIVTVVDQTTQAGLLNILYLMALLSLNLGLMNILPFPALDGGRLLFVVIRVFTGQMISDEMENRIHYAGLMVLFFLMLLVTFKDIHTFIFN